VASAAATALGPLPYRPCVLEYIRSRAAHVDEVVLATAANSRIAGRVATETGLFASVLASDERINLSGQHKLLAIRNYAKNRPFDYIGDHRKDLPIWQAAREAIVVEDSSFLQPMIQGASRVINLPSGTNTTTRDWIKQLRVHQWSKNVLLALPLILAHKVADIPSLFKCAVAFAAFCFCASAVYLINDLIDLPHDRLHSTKSRRPLARGAISIRKAAIVAAILLLASLALPALLLPILFVGMLLGYVAMNLAYSFWLKRLAIVDVLLLAGFYVYRVLIGAVAIQVTVSFWLLAFSLFFFLALGIVKRYADLIQLSNIDQKGLGGRAYTTSDIDYFRSVGLSCGCMAVLVLALYLQSEEVTRLYSHPELLWLVCPLALYWMMRVWLIASRGHMSDDPILFALRDRVSYAVGGLTALLILFATL
jgi:4-hydroxybenzoate polyprenyltransferase